LVGLGYTIKALDESSWDAFARLVEANNGVFGGCWCMGFHPDDSREPALNRESKLARVRAGRAHAALVFDGDDCVGWCQFGAPDEVPKIKNRAAYERSLTTLPEWRIACNFVGKGHRRQGVATVALEGALDLIALLGGGRVEGYPEAAGSVPAGFLFNGALSTYEKLGFVRDRTQDRQTPLGRHQSRRANAVGDLATFRGHSRTLAPPGVPPLNTELRLPPTALELVFGGKQFPVPLGDDFDGVVDHFDGGLVVDRVRRTRQAGGPLFCTGNRVLR
jgi:GNAT superfamily N-acetyltransferase